jgi:hypothetical protein
MYQVHRPDLYIVPSLEYKGTEARLPLEGISQNSKREDRTQLSEEGDIQFSQV